MPLTTYPINPRALEKALRVVGGEFLYNAVVVAYQALDQFETAGYAEGHSDGFAAGYQGGLVDADIEMVQDADDEADLMTAAVALDASMAKDPPTGEVLPMEGFREDDNGSLTECPGCGKTDCQL